MKKRLFTGLLGLVSLVGPHATYPMFNHFQNGPAEVAAPYLGDSSLFHVIGPDGKVFTVAPGGGGAELVRGLIQNLSNNMGNVADGVGNVMAKVASESVRGFNTALKDPQMAQQLNGAGGNIANLMHKPLDGFHVAANEKLFPEIGGIFRDFCSTFLNVRNVVQYGGLLGSISLFTYYGPKLSYELVYSYLLTHKPSVLLPGSKVGRMDRIRRWWNGYKSPQMIFPNGVKARLNETIEKTKNIIAHIRAGKKTTFDNLLLYGEPGTGKTLFAQILADETNMDFAATTAGALLQPEVGVKYLNELIEMANGNKHGVILFIDEADAMFVDRNKVNPDSDHYKVLNHLLALTGNGSNKFMLVAATNHAHIIDEAMGRRFQDRIHMPLPDAPTRKELLDLYVNNVLFNERDNGKQFVQIARKLMTPQAITVLVQELAGLSSAEIADVIKAMHKKAMATREGMLTADIMKRAVNEGVEKRRAQEQDKLKREQRFAAAAAA